MNLWSLFAGRDEATDRLLARHQDVQRMAQQIDRHVRVEAIQVEERCLEAPGLRVAVGHRDDPREVTHLLEELLPLCDQLILRKLNEHFLPPTRRQRSIGNAHISLSPPSTPPSLSRGYRSDHFHWNARVPRGLIRIASTRTRRFGHYKGLHARVESEPEALMRCVVDGIQFSSGCTMGKGNIGLESSTDPAVTFEKEGRRLRVALKPGWRERIDREMSKEGEIEQSLFYYAIPESDVFEIREG